MRLDRVNTVEHQDAAAYFQPYQAEPSQVYIYSLKEEINQAMKKSYPEELKAQCANVGSIERPGT